MNGGNETKLSEDDFLRMVDKLAEDCASMIKKKPRIFNRSG